MSILDFVLELYFLFTIFLLVVSQNLLAEFYQQLNSDPSCSNAIKTFEEIMYSIIEDVQKYKHDIRLLEEKVEASFKKFVVLFLN
jgi:hypothetical protein